MKRCPACGYTANPTTENWCRNKATPDGWNTYCKSCTRKRNKIRADGYRARNAALRPNPPAPVPTPLSSVPVEAASEFEITVDEPSYSAEHLRAARLEADLKTARQKIKDLEQLALGDHKIKDLIGALGPLNRVQQPEWLDGASKQQSVHGTAVLFLSDIHFDEVVSRAQVGGFNEYNREIAEESLRNTFRNAVRLLKGFMALPKYDGIVVPLGGDLLSGNIHEELVETNSAPIQVSMLALERVLAEGLAGLADEFGKVHVPCVTGNHGRMHKKPRAKNRAFENFEWSIYQRLAACFEKDSRLTFDIPEGADTFFSIYDWKLGLTHGDQFRGGNGIGGVMMPILRGASLKQVRERGMGNGFDLLLMGHWHQYIHTNQVVVNGSVKGMDEWTYQMNFPAQEPEQACFVVHKEFGCTFRMPVRCRASRADLAPRK